jgi:SSS family transporter
MRIGAFDLGLLLVYLAATIALGLKLAGPQQSARDYMVGNRDLPWWALMLSIVATETSTVTFLSVPGISYAPAGDFTFLQLPLGYCIGRLLICVLLLPQYFRGPDFSGQFVTAYEVLHRRFGGLTQRVASLMFMVTRTLADGFRLFLGAIVLQTVSDLDLNLAILLFGGVTLAFTYVGGIRAVVWTDVIQFAVYILGAAIALGVLVGQLAGGWDALLAVPSSKLRVFDPAFDITRPYTLWAGVLAGTVVAIGTHGVDQLMVQRYLCAKSMRDARLALATSGVVVLVQFAFFLLIGLGLFALYQPGTNGEAPVPKEAFARFIVEELPPGVLGIVLGAVFSAAISTLSSSINSLATVATTDVWAPLFAKHSTDAQRLRATMAFTLGFGLLQVGVGIAGQNVSAAIIDTVLSIQSFTVGIVLGVFLLGRFVPRARQQHALIALIAGLAVVSHAAFGTKVAWPWLAVIGSSTTFAVGWLTSRFAAP